MAVLDEPARFYAPLQSDWALGDVVIVPTVVLWAVGERPSPPYPQPAPAPDGSASVCYPLWTALAPLPQPSVEAWLSPAIIVADDCVLDKEFNAYVERRIHEGISAEAAEDEARANTSLDALVPVAPILP